MPEDIQEQIVQLSRQIAQLSQEHQYEHAIAIATQVSDLTSHYWGEMHPSFADSLTTLADLHYAQRKYEMAARLYRQALEILQQMLGPENPKVVAILHRLAKIDHWTGGHATAAEPPDMGGPKFPEGGERAGQVISPGEGRGVRHGTSPGEGGRAQQGTSRGKAGGVRHEPPPRPPKKKLRRSLPKSTGAQQGTSPGDVGGARAEPLQQLPADQEAERPSVKSISAWVSERVESPKEPLRAQETYHLNFKVGQPVASSLLTGADATVPTTDIPDKGLHTKWVMMVRSVELSAVSADVQITPPTNDSEPWMAQFSLHIPRDGDSAVAQLGIKPLTAEPARLHVDIHARGELYRQFLLELAVETGTSPQPPLVDVATVKAETVLAPAGHLGLTTPHEWQSPPGKLQIVVNGDDWAYATGQIVRAGTLVNIEKRVSWRGAPTSIAGPIDNLRKAAERFRAAAENYLNAIDPADLMQRLAHFEPQYDWANLKDYADGAHQQAWETVKASAELRALATAGFTLYQRLFPPGSELRSWLDSLLVGHRLDIIWQNADVPSVPWGLMYLKDPTDPIDPSGFLGLRFRIRYSKYELDFSWRHLGSLDETYQAHCLFWGDPAQDATKTAEEARWQQQVLASSANQVFVPDAQTTMPKQLLLELLRTPKPIPVRVLYLFCQCSLSKGAADPILLFGNTNDSVNAITQSELPRTPQLDHPFVFANACTTVATDPYFANELEMLFFDRLCSAYLGTETKVPIQFASRFAAIFFHFFYRKVDPAPIAAGEAVAQTRLFLWTQYKNIGGILYTYINQYDLFMAREAEVTALAV